MTFVNKSSLSKKIASISFFIIICALPFVVDRYVLYVINLIFINIIVCLGLNVLLGYGGQFAFSNAAFYGIGAYTSALLTTRLLIPYWLSIPIGAIFTAFIGLLIALPALRLKGVYLAIITIGFTHLTLWVFLHWVKVTHGGGGFEVPPLVLGVFAPPYEKDIYYITLAIAILAVLFTYKLIRSKVGRALVAIRENEIVAQALAINITTYKMIAFTYSGLLAGISGGLFAILLRFCFPENFDLFQMVMQFAMIMVGGLGSVMGTLIGASIVTILPELLRGPFTAYMEILFGALLLFFTVFMPEGIFGFIKKKGWVKRESLCT
ncbi:MAG: hypothetical protein A2157_04430 [Deltaproteobacteria bacterium RBG_16_47_11]|nr:MAG: hypothetical protein A2157_04430 [Deltaproteobacteria bacterium RBG_16_47_11]